MDTRAKILAIIASLSKKPSEPQPDESLFDSGRIDSMNVVDLAAAIEEQFGITIPDSDATPRKFETVENIESYLHTRL